MSNHPLARFRILPMLCIPDGYTVYAKGTRAFTIQRPGETAPISNEVDTVIVSVDDYKRISAQLIAEQESKYAETV